MSITKADHPVLALLRPRGGIRAVIDWVELEFTTPKPAHYRDLRHWLRVPKVDALDPGPGDYATRHSAKFHDPASFSQVAQLLRGAGVHDQTARVVGAEIAVDFYARDNSRATLAQLAHHRYRFAAQLADSDNHRVVSARGIRATVECNTRAELRDFQAGKTACVGNHGNKRLQADPVAQRWYVKTTDNNQELPLEQHRARAEITLTGPGLPFSTLEQAAAFRFTELMAWFALRRLCDDLADQPVLAQLAAHNAFQIGARRTGKARNLRHGGRREFSRLTPADIELNKRIHDALRSLTTRACADLATSEISEIRRPLHREKDGVCSLN